MDIKKRVIEQTYGCGVFTHVDDDMGSVEVLGVIALMTEGFAPLFHDMDAQEIASEFAFRMLQQCTPNMNGKEFKSKLLTLILYGDMTDDQLSRFREHMVSTFEISESDCELFDEAANTIRKNNEMLNEISRED